MDRCTITIISEFICIVFKYLHIYIYIYIYDHRKLMYQLIIKQVTSSNFITDLRASQNILVG
ncbi:hypothetical protein ACMBCM_07195, partial [Spiroplasma sp. K1]